MNKKYFYLIIAIFLVIIFYFKSQIIFQSIVVFNSTKQTISNYISNIENSISLHFNQIEKIKKLEKENKKLNDYIANANIALQKCELIQNFKQLDISHTIFTQTISYAKLPDMTSIYIDYDKKITSPKGLIYNNTAAGIAVKNIKNFSLAYLNNNPNTSYTVFIGDMKIPGVLFGGDKMIVKYIPKYHKINIGDLVVTSGLDKIFYQGVNVGKVISVTKHSLYQEAVIKPFYNSLHPSFFYVVSN